MKELFNRARRALALWLLPSYHGSESDDLLDPELLDVLRFMKKFNFATRKTPGLPSDKQLDDRIIFMWEEFREFLEATKRSLYFDMQVGPTGSWRVIRCADGEPDMVGAADALIDLVYTTKGTALVFGLPWEDLWKDVQRANMTKVRGVKVGRSSVSTGDVIKPVGWIEPRTELILRRHGWHNKHLAATTATAMVKEGE